MNLLEEYEVSKINNTIIKVWEEYPNVSVRMPLIYSRLKKNSVLFIGSNPSFPMSMKKKFSDPKLKDLANKIEGVFALANRSVYESELKYIKSLAIKNR
ncbi:MAG: hypothetical protein IPM38_05665 [Ignavibacteria bacterium]|nr:hypothetical protein [Ignavibacteria bacterium]